MRCDHMRHDLMWRQRSTIGVKRKESAEKEAFFAKDYATHNFNTGFYEVDETDLNRLAKLQAAGMVTFTTQNVVEKQQKSRYEYYRGYVYYTIDVEHTFASVKLTEAGAKLIVAEPTTMRKDIADDMKDNKDYTATMPDYMNAVYTATSSPSSPATETEEEETFQSDDSLQTTKDPNDPNAAYNTISGPRQHHLSGNAARPLRACQGQGSVLSGRIS